MACLTTYKFLVYFIFLSFPRCLCMANFTLFYLHILFPLAQVLERSYESLWSPVFSFKHDFLQKDTSFPVRKPRCYCYRNIKRIFWTSCLCHMHVSMSRACFHEKESWEGSKSHNEVTGEVRKVWISH